MDANELLPLSERLLELVRAHAWLAVAALVIGALVRLAKAGQPATLWSRIPKRAKPFVVLALGLASGVLDAALTGNDWVAALVTGLVSAAVAMAGHAALINGARSGRELGDDPPLKEPPASPRPSLRVVP